MSWLSGPGVTVVLLFWSSLAVTYLCQQQFIYFPNIPENARSFVQMPSALGMTFENIFLLTNDRVKLHAMLIRRSDSKTILHPTVLYLHGNAGNIGHQLVCAKSLQVLCDVNIFLLEYRGYGKSEGFPSEVGFRRDAQAALDYLFTREDICQKTLCVFGRSIGGAVALDIAGDVRYQNKLAAVIVENTFSSVHTVSALYVPWTRFLPGFMFRDQVIICIPLLCTTSPC